MGRRGQKPGHRPVRVAEQIKARLGSLLLEGWVKDPRLQAATLLSITDVQMTPDLKRARVYLSVFGAEDAVADQVVEALRAAETPLKNALSSDLGLRFTPHLDFRRDDSIETGSRMDQLIREVRSQDAQRASPDSDPDDLD